MGGLRDVCIQGIQGLYPQRYQGVDCHGKVSWVRRALGPRPALTGPPFQLQGPGFASLRSGRRGLSVMLATDAIGLLVMAKYLAASLLKGAQTFGQESPDQSKHPISHESI